MALFGPLAYPECRRAASRGWIILARGLAAGAMAVVAWGGLWWWWFSQTIVPGQLYLPYTLLRVCLDVLVGMAVVVALLMSPAALAGSLAGEKERGTLGLLLTARVNALEIVLGRLAGKLSQVGQMLLAGLPALVLFAGLAGMRAPVVAAMVALPAMIGCGIGGISLAFSVVSRRGRDALVAVYLLVLLILVSPLLARLLPPPLSGGLAWLSPFAPIRPLSWDEDPVPALQTMLGWGLMGLAGVAVAAWRLRPGCLRASSGEATSRRRKRRRWLVPPVDERRPVLWKELFIERVDSLGHVGRWLGLLLVLLLLFGSMTPVSLVAYYSWIQHDEAAADASLTALRQAISDTGWWVSALIQLGVGLRAAVAISSERERRTWDALLTSPLEGREIVVGKLWGSLYAMRGLCAATLWAWTLAWAFGAMTTDWYAYLVAGTAICGGFMAAVGVRTSLAISTATRSMAVTVAIWLAALAIASALSAMAVLFVGSVLRLAWWYLTGGVGAGWSLLSFRAGFEIVQLLEYALLAMLIVLDCGLRFDRIAGRASGSPLQVAVDRAFHGLPTAPVLIEPATASAVRTESSRQS